MKYKKFCGVIWAFLLLSLIAGNLPAAITEDYPTGIEKEYLAGSVRLNELLVKFREGVTQKRIAEINKEFNVTVLANIEDWRVCHVRIPKGTFIAETIKKYKHLPEVQYALLNFGLYRILLTEEMGGKGKNDFRVQQEKNAQGLGTSGKVAFSNNNKGVKDEAIIGHTNDANFTEDVLRSKLPALVDFYYPWCPHCKEIEPLLEEIAVEYKGKLKIYKVRVDKSAKGLNLQYKIEYVPTLIIFKDGKMREKIVGKISREKIIQTIDIYLKSERRNKEQ